MSRRFPPLLLFLLPPVPSCASDKGMHGPVTGGRRRRGGGGLRGVKVGPRENQSAPSHPQMVRGSHWKKLCRILDERRLLLRIADEIAADTRKVGSGSGTTMVSDMRSRVDIED